MQSGFQLSGSQLSGVGAQNLTVFFYLNKEFHFAKFLVLTKYFTIQKTTSTILRILIPVNSPRIPPKPDSLSKKLNLLLRTVTDTVSVASLKVSSALKARYFYWKGLFIYSQLICSSTFSFFGPMNEPFLAKISSFRTFIKKESAGS